LGEALAAVLERWSAIETTLDQVALVYFRQQGTSWHVQEVWRAQLGGKETFVPYLHAGRLTIERRLVTSDQRDFLPTLPCAARVTWGSRFPERIR